MTHASPQDLIRTLALALPALLLSLTVHEFAHAWVATRLGDPTPVREGRLTLDPLPHIDPIGTLLLPAIMLMFGGGMFGWAKPVRFQPANFTRRFTMWQGTALTAAAGPVSNMLLATLCALGLHGLSIAGIARDNVGMQFLWAAFQLNLVLAVFNLVPLPPLDGSYLIPRSMEDLKVFLARNGLLVFGLVFFVPLPGLGAPVGSIALSYATNILGGQVLWLTGLPFGWLGLGGSGG